MKSFYQLSLLLILSIQFSAILSQPQSMKWKKIQKSNPPKETVSIDYENPTTNKMIYKSMNLRSASPAPDNPSPTDPAVGENSSTPSPPVADDDGSSSPTNLEANTESNKPLVIEPVVSEVNPESLTDSPNPDASTESNEALATEAPAGTDVNNPDSISPATLSPPLKPSTKMGNFVLKDLDYLSKDSLSQNIESEEDLEKIVKEYNEDVSEQCAVAKKASFAHMQDVLNKAKINNMIQTNADLANVKAMYWKKLKDQENVGQSAVLDKMVHEIVDLIGPACLPSTDSQELEIAKTYLETSYRKRTITIHDINANTTIDKKVKVDVVDSMLALENTTYNEKLYYWTKWHLATDNQSEENFAIYAHTLNKAAKILGIKNGGDVMQKAFHDPMLNLTIAKLWDQIQPTMKTLKDFVIKKLKDTYGSDYTYKGKNIPAHLLGSLQGNNWEFLYSKLKPYPCLEDKPDLAEADTHNGTYHVYCQNSKKLTDSMKIPRDPKFCDSLILTERDTGNVDCHPKGYDFCRGTDYAVPVCLNNKQYVPDVHIEIEKMFYAAEYKKQPFVLRKPAHPGLEHAIARLFASQTEKLSLGDGQTGPEDELNLMMMEALRVLPQLPYALSQEKFRADVISGDLAKTQWNKHWWNLRTSYEGIEPQYNQVAGEFDPAANYDIDLDNYQYNRFLGIIMYYQLLESSCSGIISKQCTKDIVKTTQKPLHQCSLIGKADFGAKLKAAQALGSSADWKKIWKNLTGTDEIDASALIEYFKPATDYMQDQISDYSYYWWAIIVGIIIILLIIIIILYFVIRKCLKKKRSKKAALAAKDNPVATEQGEVGDEGTYKGLESKGEGSTK